MPHIDKRTGELVIRIVYDGLPEAGKTTNVVQLGEMIALHRRGARASPGTQGARTEYFDWLDFSGGFIDGRRVRCQLVTVPGQPHLLHRRRYLLDAADAVVYVADARSSNIEASALGLGATRRLLPAHRGLPPVGVIVQGNKQDLPGALGPGELARALQLEPAVAVVPSIASAGKGVLETFILATRLATDRTRASSAEHGFCELESEDPEQLHRAMTAREAAEAAPAGSSVNSQRPGAACVAAAFHGSGRRNACTPELAASLGPGLEISAGHVWPPVKGRALLANVCTGPFSVPEFVCEWAPRDAIELVSASGWRFHSASHWTFATEASAKLELLRIVRQQLSVPDLVFEARAAFLVSTDEGFRLWVLSGPARSVTDDFIDALRARDANALSRLWRAVLEFDGQQQRSPELRAPAAALSLTAGRFRSLALADTPLLDQPPSNLRPLLVELAARLESSDPGCGSWLAALVGASFE